MSLILYPIAILSHEVLAIFLPYIIAIYFLLNKITKNNAILIGALLLPSILSFFSSLYFKPSVENIDIIYQSIAQKNYSVEGGAISYLDKDAVYGFNRLMGKIESRNYIQCYSLVLILSMIAFIPIQTYIKQLYSNKFTSTLILISLIGSIPIFLVAIDWGRFIYIHLVSLFTLSLVASYQYSLEKTNVLPLFIICRQCKSNVLAIAFAFVFSMLWHIPHSGNSPFAKNYKQINVFNLAMPFHRILVRNK
ncbi:MAG TPA: hypothetical protein ENH82_18830 [bacterium]|nr:hypothetical protein [bacterium]